MAINKDAVTEAAQIKFDELWAQYVVDVVTYDGKKIKTNDGTSDPVPVKSQMAAIRDVMIEAIVDKLVDAIEG